MPPIARTFAAGAALLAAATLTTAATAGEKTAVTVNPNGTLNMNVKYRDLRLDDPSDMKILERRISRAASRVCLGGNGKVPLAEAAKYSACFRTTKANALAQVKTRMGSQPALASR